MRSYQISLCQSGFADGDCYRIFLIGRFAEISQSEKYSVTNYQIPGGFGIPKRMARVRNFFDICVLVEKITSQLCFVS